MPELRKDPIRDRWVIFSPERLRRPQPVRLVLDTPVEDHDPFLEGREHLTPPEVFAIREGLESLDGAGNQANGPGWKVRVVPNRFPALRVEGNLGKEPYGLFDWMNGIGAHEVVIETPRPDVELHDLDLASVGLVFKAWRARMLDLENDKRLVCFQVFKNSGPLAGATLPHAHSQIMALPFVPHELQMMLNHASRHQAHKDRNLFSDVLREELRDGRRVITQNHGFVGYCPYASSLPFEMVIQPRVSAPWFSQASDHDLLLAADLLRRLLRRLAQGLDRPSFNVILYTAPIARGSGESAYRSFCWHLRILPRLAGYAGFEWASGHCINPVLPEEAAAFLRGGLSDD